MPVVADNAAGVVFAAGVAIPLSPIRKVYSLCDHRPVAQVVIVCSRGGQD